MVVKIAGGGSQYATVTVDADGNYFDGGKTRRLHLPPNIPINNFWSLIPYDTQTRSILQTDQRDTALSSDSGTVKTNADGSVDVYFRTEGAGGQGGQLDSDDAGQGLVQPSCVSTAGSIRGLTRPGVRVKSNS